jgi:glyoxylase-like metal-dependent hydrolase (beta-lactamase superfamily II)
VELLKDLYAYIWTNISINNCNTYLIKADETTILIDPGLEYCAEGVLKNIKKDGFDPDKIGLIITTHSHPDHFEGVKRFMHNDTKMALHLEEDKFIRESGIGFYKMFGLRLPEYRIDFPLQEGEFKVNNTALEIYHTPGHSPGSISIYWPEKKALIVGDVVFQAGVGRTDFAGGNGNLLKKSIERLSQLDVEYLLPGHGDIVKGKNRVKRNFEYVADVYYNLI